MLSLVEDLVFRNHMGLGPSIIFLTAVTISFILRNISMSSSNVFNLHFVKMKSIYLFGVCVSLWVYGVCQKTTYRTQFSFAMMWTPRTVRLGSKNLYMLGYLPLIGYIHILPFQPNIVIKYNIEYTLYNMQCILW